MVNFTFFEFQKGDQGELRFLSSSLFSQMFFSGARGSLSPLSAESLAVETSLDRLDLWETSVNSGVGLVVGVLSVLQNLV